MNNKSQCYQILRDLKRGETLTDLDAMAKYGCHRLAARVLDLRKRGIAVKTEMVHLYSGKRIAEYSL